MAFSGTVSILALKDGDFQYTSFAGTTAGLQAAIDYIGSSGGKVWIGPGTLTISTAITLNSDIMVQGSGMATILAVSGGVQCFTLSSDDRVQIRDMKIDCTSQTGSNHAISLTTCNDCVLEDLWIEDAQASAVLLTTTSCRNRLNRIKVTQPANTGTNSIHVFSGSCDNTIENCDVRDAGTSTSDYNYRIDTNSHRNKISNCHSYNAYANAFVCTGGGTGSGSNENVFVNCVSERHGRAGGSLSGFKTRFHCIGNQFVNCIARRGGATSGTPASQDGFTAHFGSHHTKFVGCKAAYNEGYGFSLTDADFCTIDGCEAVDNQDPGIRVEKSYHNNIVGNLCARNGGHGVAFESLAATNKSFQAVDWSQVGGSGNIYVASDAQINSTSAPVVRLVENGNLMAPFQGTAILAESPSGETVLTVESSSGLSAGDTVVVTNLYGQSLNTVTTVSSVDSGTQITVGAAQTGEIGDIIIKLNGTDPAGAINGVFYLDRKNATPRAFVCLSDKTAPGDDEVTAGNGINFSCVTGNTCYANGESGISIEGGSFNTVTGNTCISNRSAYGVYVADAVAGGARSDYNAIVGNNLSEYRASSPTDDRQQTYGVRIDDANCDFNLVAGNICALNKTGQVSFQTVGGNVAANNLTGTTGFKGADIASAATITLDDTSSYFDITGTTSITSVTASWAGRTVTLQFDGVLTFTDGSNLKIDGNFTTAATDTITLICDGTNWHEVSRSANST